MKIPSLARRSWLVLLLAVAPAVPAAERSLAERLKPMLTRHKGQVSAMVKNLKTGESFTWRAEAPMPTASLIKLAVMVEVYRQEVGEGQGQVVLMRDAWIADSREEAYRQYAPYWLPVIKYYWRAGLPELSHLTSESEITMETMAPPIMVIGNPRECVDDLRKWRDVTGASYFVLRIRQEHSGGPPHNQVMAAIRRFGEEVLPDLE